MLKKVKIFPQGWGFVQVFCPGEYFLKIFPLGGQGFDQSPGGRSRLELMDALQSIIKGRCFGSLFTMVTKKYIH